MPWLNVPITPVRPIKLTSINDNIVLIAASQTLRFWFLYISLLLK